MQLAIAHEPRCLCRSLLAAGVAASSTDHDLQSIGNTLDPGKDRFTAPHMLACKDCPYLSTHFSN
jgi:hypothetical protein